MALNQQTKQHIQDYLDENFLFSVIEISESITSCKESSHDFFVPQLKKSKKKSFEDSDSASREMNKASPRSLQDLDSRLEETFSQHLFTLIREKGVSEVEIYKAARIDRKLFSKIRSHDDYMPKKETALTLALALRLSLDETLDLL